MKRNLNSLPLGERVGVRGKGSGAILKQKNCGVTKLTPRENFGAFMEQAVGRKIQETVPDKRIHIGLFCPEHNPAPRSTAGSIMKIKA